MGARVTLKAHRQSIGKRQWAIVIIVLLVILILFIFPISGCNSLAVPETGGPQVRQPECPLCLPGAFAGSQWVHMGEFSVNAFGQYMYIDINSFCVLCEIYNGLDRICAA